MDRLTQCLSLPRQKRCVTSVQRTVEGAFLHICSFPATDVLLYVEIHISVVERDTNTSLYKRAVCVEDHCKFFNIHCHTVWSLPTCCINTSGSFYIVLLYFSFSHPLSASSSPGPPHECIFRPQWPAWTAADFMANKGPKKL